MNPGAANAPLRPSPWPMFGVLATGLALLLAIVFAVHYAVDARAQAARRDADEFRNVELARRAVAEDIAAVTTDLMFLGRLMQQDVPGGVTDPPALDAVADLFLVFAREKALYDQVRYLDLSGREVVRVDRSLGAPRRVEPERLQDKSSRYYVSQALQMETGQVYLSPFDLNVEDDRIEHPIKPVLRFATPVLDSAGRRRGLVILNYLGERLLARFRRAAANSADQVQLLNGEGHWLSSPRPDEAWGFMLGRDDTFALRYPGAWRRIRTESAGQFETPDGVFTFATVRPATEAASVLPPGRVPTAQGEVWKVVSHRGASAAATALAGFAATHAALYLGLLAILGLLAFLLANAQVQRRAAEAQRAYEQRFRRTLEDIHLAAMMVDLRGRLTFCNRFLLTLSGRSPGEAVGRDWVECFVAAEQRVAVRELQHQLQLHGHFPATLEIGLDTRDGRRLIAWNSTPARDAQGVLTGLTAIGEDITERRAAEEQVRQLSRAVEQSPASVVITDRAGLIEYVNPKFTAVTGYALDEVIGRNPRFLKSGETGADEYADLWRSLLAGGEWRGEFHNRRKDGTLYWESAVISALRDAHGESTHFLAVKEDITERKRLEQEVDARNRELARVQALAAMGRMASMLAHDLANPLSSVKMAVQILGRRATDQEAGELAAIGLEQVQYMERIIAEMLTYARPGELEIGWLDAARLLTGVIGTVQRRIDEYGVAVDVDCPPGLPSFPGDASKLRQLFSNLLVNALQAVAVRPAAQRRVTIHVDLATLADGRALRFRVCDNGAGIEPEVRERLFEPFFTTRAKGTGLGLAIVRQITDLHHAAIALTDNEPVGTCAVLVLPLTPAVPEGEAAAVASRREET